MHIYYRFVRLLLRNYVIGSLIAVLGVGGVLVFSTLQIPRHDVLLLAETLVISLCVIMGTEFVVFLRHMRPILNFFRKRTPALEDIQYAYHQVHKMPSLTVRRIAGPHWLGLSLPATLITMYEIHRHLLHLPPKMVWIAVIASVLVAGMHAMIEYFLTSSV